MTIPKAIRAYFKQDLGNRNPNAASCRFSAVTITNLDRFTSTNTQPMKTTTQLPITLFIHAGKPFGVILGPEKFIVTDNEFIHGIWNNNEKAGLRGSYPEYKEQDYSVEELRTEDNLDFADFGHYWGIKQRIAANYSGLLKSMREIGVSTKDMPKFGERS